MALQNILHSQHQRRLIHGVTFPLTALLNVGAYVIMVVVNGLANSLPLNGQTTGEVSARIPSLFTPASFTFSIWGLIYLLLLVFVIYQLLPSQHTALFSYRIGYWFVLSCGANAVWLILWHYEQFVLTFIVMLGLLASLLMIYRRLNSGRRRVTGGEKWMVNVPFSVYLGWVSVATLANFTVVVYTLGLDSLGLPPVLFTLLLLLIATGLGIMMILRRHEIAYPLVIIWALVGIAARHQQQMPIIAIPAALLACILIITLLLVRIETNPELLNGVKTP